jgi:hypothetical protein
MKQLGSIRRVSEIVTGTTTGIRKHVTRTQARSIQMREMKFKSWSYR